jgi:hypothetical protein
MSSNPDALFDHVLDDIMEDERATTARRFHDQLRRRAEPIDESDDLYMLNFSI